MVTTDLSHSLPEPATDPRQRERFYHPELDTLRFFAFLGVFLFHNIMRAPSSQVIESPLVREIIDWVVAFTWVGEHGVDLFFVLSSYLITELLLREIQQFGKLDVRSFYFRRGLRIWPLYYVFFAFVYFCEPALLLFERLKTPYALGYTFFLANWSYIWMQAVPNTTATILWTVSIEEQFYLVWPLVCRWLNPRRIAWTAGGLLLVTNLVRWYILSHDGTLIDIKFNTFCRLDGIACGALLALYLNGGAPILTLPARRLLIGGGLFLALAGTRYLRVSPIFEYAELLTFPTWTAAAVMILLGTLRQQGEARGIWTSPTLVYLGRISYGLYVFHYFCMVLLMARLPQLGASTLTRTVASFALTVGLAMLSYHYLELPFLRLKKLFTHIASRPEEERVEPETAG